MVTYKGCQIFLDTRINQYVWEEQAYGVESDDGFDTIAAAQADIDQFFMGPATQVTYNEVERSC